MPNLGIHMSESDLTSPEPEFVTNVYETFVDLLAGVSKEELNQPQFVGLGELEYPELHEDSIPRLALYRATYVFFLFPVSTSTLKRTTPKQNKQNYSKDLLESSGCSNFKMAHLLKPSYKTFRSHLSALINFAKFREERAVSYTKFTAETDQLMESKISLDDKKNDLESKVETLRIEKENKMPEIKDLKKTCQSLESEISSLNKQQAMLRHNHEELKMKCKDFKKKQIEDKQREKDVEIECERLRSQIVHSPGRFEAEVQNIQRLLKEEKAECAVLEKRRREMQDRVATLNREHGKVTKTLNVLNDLNEHIEKVKEAQNKREEMESTITIQRAELEDLETLKDHLRRQLKRHETRTFEIRQQHGVKNEAARQALAAAQADLQDGMQSMDDMEAESERIKTEMERVQLNIEEEAKAHEEMMQSRRELFEGLADQVGKYNVNMTAKLFA